MELLAKLIRLLQAAQLHGHQLFFFFLFATVCAMRNHYEPNEAAKECIVADCIQLSFSNPEKHHKTAKTKVRKMNLKNRICYQIETFTGNKAFHKNIDAEALLPALSDLFRQYRTAECSGAEEKLFFSKTKQNGITLTKRIAAPTAWSETHDKRKTYILKEGVPLPFLQAQGIMNADGAVLKKQYHKFRQINKFLEFTAACFPFIKARTKMTKRPFSITDFGCGKAYLSFALYYYLHKEKQLPVTIRGLDLKTDVVRHCNTLAETCGYSGLSFLEGNIAEYPLPEHTDMVVCLHACDTATDLALAQAVQRDVPFIYAVPCCQHEIHNQLKQHKMSFKTGVHIFYPFMEHGIVTERFTALLTDTLRGLLLEVCGYTVHIMEFIETEHTPKNILIRAVKKTAAGRDERHAALKKYRQLTELFCLKPCLERLLAENGTIPLQN